MANETDQIALMAFKAAIDQDPFGALSSWNDSLHYCDWNGVLCSHRHPDRVTILNLTSQGLVGTLSPHIGNLSFLRAIYLKKNSFHGQIPPDIGNLFRLQHIEFANNSFDGEIPKNLSRCQNLKYLSLIDNSLTGNIPPELGSLLKLEALGLARNKLSGTIPPSIGNLSSLNQFSIGFCRLHGKIPEEIAQIRGLRFVQFAENNLSGKIPSGLYNISSIYYLAMGSNQLEGTIPPDIGLKLPNLEFLGFGFNRFTGMIPSSLMNASKLQYLVLVENNLTGPVPRDLGKLQNLRGIWLSYNQLQDDFSFVTCLTNCSFLKTIEVDRNLFKGSLPSSVANLSKEMSYLSMQANQLHGNIPSGIENLLNLDTLRMSENYLTGPLPSGIGKLYKLQDLYLGENSFTGELPSSIGNLTLLNLLYLNQNNITGSIPSSLGNCQNLLELFLSNNSLSGSIPRELLNISSISIYFSLGHNALTGSLPSEVGSFRDLVVFDVSNNRLSGKIPSSLRYCVGLEKLYLQENSFEGQIPEDLGFLRGLELLDLSHNNLSGTIPTNLRALVRLQTLNLSFNELEGEVPIGVFKNASAISVIGNVGLCGGIADLKLSPCPSVKSKKNVAVVIIPVVIGVFGFLAALICLVIFIYRRRMSRKKGSLVPSFNNQLLRLSYGELLKATDGFSNANLIGVGGYSSVYKGILDQDQLVVAVKVLNLNLRGASKSFMSECKALRSIRHRNLLKILSACSSVDFQGNDFKALVYEFKTNGSLENWLHQERVGDEGQQEEPRNLKLVQRLDIAIDIAAGLEYLHHGGESRIVHGDLKPSNVLLDHEMTAQIGDFGLAKVISMFSNGQHTNSVAVNGTVGYVAPGTVLSYFFEIVS